MFEIFISQIWLSVCPIIPQKYRKPILFCSQLYTNRNPQELEFDMRVGGKLLVTQSSVCHYLSSNMACRSLFYCSVLSINEVLQFHLFSLLKIYLFIYFDMNTYFIKVIFFLLPLFLV